MRTWNLSHSLKGTSVSLTEVPFRAWAAQELGDLACEASKKLTGRHLCEPPEWTYAVRWGPADEDGYTERSLGSKLFGLAQALHGGFGAYRKGEDIDCLPVSYEWVREHQPDAGWPWDGTEGTDGE